MSRIASAAVIKGRHTIVREAPAAGSHVRSIYDHFKTNAGLPVAFTHDRRNRHAVDQLRDFYGLDIRRVRNGTYVLAGEWFGRVYVDYIAERLASADTIGAA